MSIRYAAALALGLGVVPAAVAQSEIQWKPAAGPAPGVPTAQKQPEKSAAPVVVPAVPAPTGLATSTAFPDPTGTCCPDVCCPGGRVWTSAEWLYWTTSGQSLTPLAAASVPGTPRGAAGVAGVPTTLPLFGTDRVNNDFRSGFRLNAGVWLNDRHTWGVEGDFFFLGQSRDSFTGSTLDNPILARPFFNAATGLADAQLVSFPGAAVGVLTADSTTNVIGGGVNAVRNLRCSPCGRLDLLLGYRYLNVRDQVTVSEALATDPAAGIGATPALGFAITDQFRTSNNFHGGVIGLAAERRANMFYVNVRASVALGGNRQVTDISGSTVLVTPAGEVQQFPGGLLAQPSNIGHYSRTVFAVMPEVGIRGGVQVTQHARAYVGYNFMYLSNVVRAGDQIDPRVNPAQLPPGTGGGLALPAFPNRTTDFWAQGVSVGLELRY